MAVSFHWFQDFYWLTPKVAYFGFFQFYDLIYWALRKKKNLLTNKKMFKIHSAAVSTATVEAEAMTQSLQKARTLRWTLVSDWHRRCVGSPPLTLSL